MENITRDYSSQELSEVPDEVIKSSDFENLILDFNNIAIIPPILCKRLSHLKCLSLNGNFLETLPLELDELSVLNELYLKENELLTLPETLGNLKFLRVLHITGNHLKKLPERISSLHNLKELLVNENNIEKLPAEFGKLLSLKHLDLSSNVISVLPDSFGQLNNLIELNLSNNLLMILPDSFKDLPCLEIIDMTHNKISILPETFLSSKVLKKLLLSHNNLVYLPPWFADLEHIEEIFLECNALQDMPFPETFGDISAHLEYLDLNGNNITLLSENFGNLKKLRYLDLGSPLDEPERSRFIANGNSLYCLPSSFTNLQCLTDLQLDENEIKELPDDFGNLVNIRFLDLSHNILKVLPDSFCQLKNMKTCILSMNYLSCLPEDFGLLSAIQDLKLDNNLLSQVPKSFECLSEVVSLDLYKNKLTEIPSVLTALKNLKHLDLRENDIDLELDELPEIFYSPTYPKRNPQHSNNWRGRIREDISSAFWVDSKEAKMNDENSENSVLYQALKSSSSLWRKHGQNVTRENSANVDVAKQQNDCFSTENAESDSSSAGYFSNTHSATSLSDCDIQMNGKESAEISSSPNKCDSIASNTEFWDEDLLPIPQSQSDQELSTPAFDSPVQDNTFDDADLSDWESETRFESPGDSRKGYRHPQKMENFNIFVPSDLHPPRVQAVAFWYPEEDGQFEDADL